MSNKAKAYLLWQALRNNPDYIADYNEYVVEHRHGFLSRHRIWKPANPNQEEPPEGLFWDVAHLERWDRLIIKVTRPKIYSHLLESFGWVTANLFGTKKEPGIVKELSLGEIFDHPEVGEDYRKLQKLCFVICKDEYSGEENRVKAKKILKKFGDSPKIHFSSSPLRLPDALSLPVERGEIYLLCEEICNVGSYLKRVELLAKQFAFLNEDAREEIAMYVQPGEVADMIMAKKYNVGKRTMKGALAEANKEWERIKGVSGKTYIRLCSNCEALMVSGEKQKTLCRDCMKPPKS